MAARRFTQTIGGETYHGLLFNTEQEMEEFLGARGIVLLLGDHAAPSVTSATSAPTSDEPRAPGRPSLDAIIGQAIEALGRRLDEATSVAAQARMVRAYLGQTLSPGAVPGERTVRAYLKLNPRARVG